MRKLIYIDDEKNNLILFEMSYQDKFDIYTSQSGKEALELIKKENIKVVITDYKMPKMNGMELINQVKSFQPDSICMILSAYQEVDVITEKSKIYKYIVKPFDQDELLKDIEEAFSMACA